VIACLYVNVHECVCMFCEGLENATLNSECLDPHKDDHEHSMDDESTPGTQEVNNERMSDPELSPSERVSSNNVCEWNI